MKYIWSEYSAARAYRAEVDARKISPYQEILECDEKICVFNPWLRFSEIFSPLAEIQDPEIENLLAHFLAQLDRKCGASVGTIRAEIFGEEIENGACGEKARRLYLNLPESEKKIVAEFLRRYEDSGRRRIFFREAVQEFFPAAAIYFNQRDRKFLLYLPQKETASDGEKISLLKILFLDATAELRVFWEKHFGIIGREKTMRLGQICLY